MSSLIRGLSVLLLLGIGSTLWAVPGGLRIRMVSEVTEIRPGEPFYVGLYLQHDPGYHTYWKCPGIVGVPTQIDWALPHGFVATELQFPEPERVHMYEILAQGYERDVLIEAKVTPPSNLKPGSKVTVGGKVWWMCCAQECNPDARDLSVTLPVGTGDEIRFDEEWQGIFEEERGRQALQTETWTASATEQGDDITLVIRHAGGRGRLVSKDEVDDLIVFTEDGWIDSNKPQEVSVLDRETVQFRLKKAAVYLEDAIPSTLRVIVQRAKGWLKQGYSRSLQLAPVIERFDDDAQDE